MFLIRWIKNFIHCPLFIIHSSLNQRYSPSTNRYEVSMTNEEVLKIFEVTHALLKGHFRLSSGRHSDRYLQCALVLQYPWHAEKLGQAMAEKVEPLGPQVILAPAMGGLFVGHELARALKVR